MGRRRWVTDVKRVSQLQDTIFNFRLKFIDVYAGLFTASYSSQNLYQNI